MILWKKFDQFERGTNFYAWACQVARLEVKEFRRQTARERLILNDAFVDAVSYVAVELEHESKDRMKALQKCVEVYQKTSVNFCGCDMTKGGQLVRLQRQSTALWTRFTKH